VPGTAKGAWHQIMAPIYKIKNKSVIIIPTEYLPEFIFSNQPYYEYKRKGFY